MIIPTRNNLQKYLEAKPHIANYHVFNSIVNMTIKVLSEFFYSRDEISNIKDKE